MGGSSSLTNGTVLMWDKINEWNNLFIYLFIYSLLKVDLYVTFI